VQSTSSFITVYNEIINVCKALCCAYTRSGKKGCSSKLALSLWPHDKIKALLIHKIPVLYRLG
jgi:hypothetical protein